MKSYPISYLKKKAAEACILFLALLTAPDVFCQKSEFDTVIYNTVVQVAGRDMNKAIKIADSLIHHSTIPLHKVKSLMLMADLQLNTGKTDIAIDYALKADDIASTNGFTEWQARIYGFLSTQYRSIGQKKQSKIYIDKGFAAIDKIDNKNKVNEYYGLMHQEAGLYNVDTKQYQEAIKSFQSAEPYFSKLENIKLRSYQLATNNGQLGRVYLLQKDYAKAISTFNKGLDYLSKIENEASIVKGFMFEGIAQAYLEEGKEKNAFGYLEKALNIAEDSQNLNLQNEVYCDLAIYYLETGNKVKYKQYNALFQKTLEKIIDTDKKSSEDVVNRLQEKETDLANQRRILFGGLILFAIVMLGIGYSWRRKRKKEYARFWKVISELREERTARLKEIEEVSHQDIAFSTVEESPKEFMSEEAEGAILKKLLRFEEGNKFTSKNISLSVLSAKLNVNSKYLSHVINRHKRKDFNSYINELRIKYIIAKMEEDPAYLNYKISYLAEEAGFSSHSKFTAVFKVVTNMSPSTFMQYLAKSDAVHSENVQ